MIPEQIETELDDYEIHAHTHNFAIWAAARAAQRGVANATVGAVGKAIKVCGIESCFEKDAHLPTSHEAFEAIHRKWCYAIQENLGECDGISYGRAAKIIAIYLKTTVVIPQRADPAFIKVVHPPIDRILLKAIGKHIPDLKDCHEIRWTQLDEEPYYKLIRELRKSIGDRPFWKLEWFWNGERQSPH